MILISRADLNALLLDSDHAGFNSGRGLASKAHELRDELHEKIDKIEEAGLWKPIDTLEPAEGLRVLTCTARGHIEIGAWEKYPIGWILKSEIPDNIGYAETIEATHWMPLPERAE